MLSQAILHRLAPALFTSQCGLPQSLPGPPPTRFLGVGGALRPWGEDSLGHATKLFAEYGPIVALVKGGGMRHINPSKDCPGTVLCYGADVVEKVTLGHETFRKAHLSGALRPGPNPNERELPLMSFGAGLFAVNGDEHRRHRRLLSSAFSRRKLSDYFHVMEACTKQWMAGFEAGQVRDLSQDFRVITSDIVLATLLGGTDPQIRSVAAHALSDALSLMGKPLTRLLRWDVRGLPYWSYLEAAAELDGTMRKVVAERRQSLKETDSDMLASLLLAHDAETDTKLDDADILGHASVIFAAGHETSSNALSWTIFLLAYFPDVVAKIRAELSELPSGLPTTADELERLTYLGNVVKESLRILTPAPWNGRILGEDTEFFGHKLPRGTEILVSLYQTHRNADVFPEPQRFVPERWNGLRPTPFEYNPFSAGPRTCIGAAFATMEIKLVLAHLLGRFDVEVTPQKVDRFAEMVLSPKQGLVVALHPRASLLPRRPQVDGNVFEMVDLPDAGAFQATIAQ